ncbi:MAG: hypothetical protein WBM50_23870 [Acidimicrobiales bacterium]
MRSRRSVWWLWPSAPLLLVVASTLVAANAVPAAVFERAWRTPKELDDDTTVLLFSIVVGLVVGASVAAMAERDPVGRPGRTWPSTSNETLDLLRKVYPWLLVVTLFGYLTWVANGISRGLTVDDVRAVLATQDNFKLPVKEKLQTLPGITTLTQVAIPAAIVGVVIDLQRPSRLIRWSYRFIVVLAAARALMLAERLAVAEILVPIAVLRAADLGHRLERRPRLLVSLAPLLGVLVLLVGFAASEYSRSWNWYETNGEQSFLAFSSERLLGYYATSHNNGALLVKYGTGSADVPYYTTSFVWEIPPGSVVAAGLADDAGDERRSLLREFANPEFNSPSGLASVLADYGRIGGFLFAVGMGLLIGAIHLGFIHGRLLGVLLYPIVFTGLLELPRYLYWFQGRATPAIVVTLALAGYLAAQARGRLRWQRLETAIARPAGLSP